MSATATKLLTAEQFALRLRPEDGSHEELVRGEIITMAAPSFRHGEVAAQIVFVLKTFLQGKRLGRVLGETGVRTEFDPDSVRGPDVSYWSFKRVPKSQQISTYPKAPADLCIEIRSPSNTPRKLRAKIAEYLRASVRMVWVVDPREASVTVHRSSGRSLTLHDEELLDGEDVLPGFSCPVSRFFEI